MYEILTEETKEKITEVEFLKKQNKGMVKTDLSNRMIVKISNNFNMASYSVSSIAMDLLFLFMTETKNEDDDVSFFRVTSSEIEKKLGKRININSLQRAAIELRRSPVLFYWCDERTGKVTTSETSFCHTITYNDSYVELMFSNAMKKYLLNLKSRFTYFQLENTSSLSSKYSKRLYLFLKQYENTHILTISVEDLKKMLQNNSSQYFNFKKDVINVAIKEINEKTDIKISVKEYKKNKNVERLEFSIYENEKVIKRRKEESAEKNPPKRKMEKEMVVKDGVLAVQKWLESKYNVLPDEAAKMKESKKRKDVAARKYTKEDKDKSKAALDAFLNKERRD